MWFRLAAPVLASVVLASAPGCAVVTFAHPIGYHYIEFEGRFHAAELAESARSVLADRGATDIRVEFLELKEEDPRFVTAYISYATVQHETTYHHRVRVDCASTCWTAGAENCATQRCAISGGANEATLGAEYVKALLAAFEKALDLPTDTRGPPRTELEPDPR